MAHSMTCHALLIAQRLMVLMIFATANGAASAHFYEKLCLLQITLIACSTIELHKRHFNLFVPIGFFAFVLRFGAEGRANAVCQAPCDNQQVFAACRAIMRD